MNNALILGVSSSLGRALVRRLHQDGVWVRGADIRYSGEGPFECDDFYRTDLRNPESAGLVLMPHPMHEHFDAVFNVATPPFLGDLLRIALNVFDAVVRHKERVGKLIHACDLRASTLVEALRLSYSAEHGIDADVYHWPVGIAVSTTDFAHALIKAAVDG
jgi:nucleoside-diphosphate-sugar epimerase